MLVDTLLPNWLFRIQELSPCHYTMEGHDPLGRNVSADGSDETQLAWQVTYSAIELLRRNAIDTPQNYTHLRPNPIVDSLSPELRRLLIGELLLGNEIAECWTGWGTVALLKDRFRTNSESIVAPLEYILVDDPHYWHEEIRMIGTELAVAAR